MKDKVEILTIEDMRPILDELESMKNFAEELCESTTPLFDGRRFMTDTHLSRRLKVCKRTLASYRSDGILGYYNLPGKILYADIDVDRFLERHYLPPFR